jgi:GMP synthase (glutamine-hydrolysing)
MATPQALVLRHVPFEDLDGFAAALDRRGVACRPVDVAVDPVDPVAGLTADLLVVMGGPIGADRTDLYPFLRDEIRLIRRRLDEGLPTLGICLGCQLMARALGARIHSGAARELGWAPVALTDAGRASPLAALDGTPVLHWHGDTFDLPDGAVLLASTTACANQAFAWGRSALGLQFHPEVTARGFERWLVGHAVEIAGTPGITVPGLRDATARHADGLAAAGARFLDAWLDGVGL